MLPIGTLHASLKNMQHLLIWSEPLQKVKLKEVTNLIVL
jgi:hypothetical protein